VPTALIGIFNFHRAKRLIRVNSWTEKSVKMTLLHQLCGICVPDLRNLREIEAYPDLDKKQ
jgi:hypothetical protein